MIYRKQRKKMSLKINSGSMADIGFLLLIFFLVSTTIKDEKGIAVRLPPLDEDVNYFEPSNKNICKVLINHENQLLVNSQRMNIENLTNFLKIYITNPQMDPTLSSGPTKAIISIQNDRSSSYHMYVNVYNEIKKAYNQIRDENAIVQFGLPFQACNKVQRKEIARMVPINIFEIDDFSSSNIIL